MEIVERQLLHQCVRTLYKVHDTLLNEQVSALIDEVPSGKSDSLYLDVLPENVMKLNLIQDYDSHIVLVTEEKGQFNFSEISNAEVVIFADPTDRSKHLRRYIELGVENKIITRRSVFGDLLSGDENFVLWRSVDKEPNQEVIFPVSITGPCCALTVVKRGEILFALNLNYITGELVVACQDFIGFTKMTDIREASAGKEFSGLTEIVFEAIDGTQSKQYVTYLGKQYSENLKKTRLVDDTFQAVAHEPGGPLRILYLSDINPNPSGFIFSNGEKIGEWIHWLAFCRYSQSLAAYSIYPETFFAKDGILMTPSPPYSILETGGPSLKLNFEKLRYLENPSRYREMVLVTHRYSPIRARIEANESRILFSHIG